jgi:hypothetical protein
MHFRLGCYIQLHVLKDFSGKSDPVSIAIEFHEASHLRNKTSKNSTSKFKSTLLNDNVMTAGKRVECNLRIIVNCV